MDVRALSAGIVLVEVSLHVSRSTTGNLLAPRHFEFRPVVPNDFSWLPNTRHETADAGHVCFTNHFRFS